MGQFEHFTGMPGTLIDLFHISYYYEAIVISTSYTISYVARHTAPDSLMRDIVLTKT
jgi:hypothetical protein